MCNIPAFIDKETLLDKNSRYIITVGAVEASSAVLFHTGKRTVRFIMVPKGGGYESSGPRTPNISGR